MEQRTVTLHSRADLIDFIKSTPMEMDQLKKLLAVGYGIFIYGDEGKQKIIDSLQALFNKFGNQKELPLFLD